MAGEGLYQGNFLFPTSAGMVPIQVQGSENSLPFDERKGGRGTIPSL